MSPVYSLKLSVPTCGMCKDRCMLKRYVMFNPLTRIEFRPIADSFMIQRMAPSYCASALMEQALCQHRLWQTCLKSCCDSAEVSGAGRKACIILLALDPHGVNAWAGNKLF